LTVETSQSCANQVTNIGDIRAAVASVKMSGKSFQTNLFLRDDEIAARLEKSGIRALKVDGAVLFLVREDHFFRLYFAVADPALLVESLPLLNAPEGEVIVADVVGPKPEVDAVAHSFASAGFSQRACLHRLQRLGSESLLRGEPASDVENARPEDAPEILRLLNDNFDVYSDQIPTLAQIHRAIASCNILVLREGAIIGGLFYYESLGLTTHARYWLALPGYRERAMDLIHHYFKNCASHRRFVLWVHDDNERIHRIHRLLGYKPDSIIDTVWMKKG
jgi:hypothetical protein